MNGVNNSNEWKPLTRLEKRDRAEMIARNRSTKLQVFEKGVLRCEAH